jgi:protein TonB
MAAFQGRLMAHLGKHKRYPMSARQRRQQGTAWVRLTLDRHGRVLSRQLERGCGVEALDREAEELLDRAQPLPPIPPEMLQDQMELVLPVEFSLR